VYPRTFLAAKMAQPEPYSSYLNEKMSRKNAKLIWLEMEGLNV